MNKVYTIFGHNTIDLPGYYLLVGKRSLVSVLEMRPFRNCALLNVSKL